MIKKMDHIGIAVTSIEDSLPFYTETIQLKLEGIEVVESEQVKVAFLKIGDSKIELLEPLTSESPIAKFIEKRGEGIHHIALAVDSIEERIDEIKKKGIQMLQENPKIGAGGAKIAFMHPRSTGKVLFEFCEKDSKEDTK
ncbi:methylmalonyl-CoA epimerase [Fredinandcohnia quinoae]|uniref:Methylmalonyl-CoA epimerase n=1 Tax=Fredinandcohnia quinoae TaxID=2918902 RepID=A0AAW5E166_9BACI|nr:methylmalonyl-CoA epimerase [Fredinandcohnia sp. SECRCQ15]MCH1626657.1 methylmalonyl-CoA epimerase [Fredinandcohnia sp. SECRCQ15]